MHPPSKTPVTLDGQEYFLCGSIAELVKAEIFFGQAVSDVSLGDAIVAVNKKDGIGSALRACRQLFPCALYAHHRVGWDEAQEMLDRALRGTDTSIVTSIMRDMWPPKTAETEAANLSLHYDLLKMAEAEEAFGGKAGLLLACVKTGRFKLEDAWRIFPVALHHARPELNLEQARALMTLESVAFIHYGMMSQDPTDEVYDQFTQRLKAVTSDDDKREFLLRIMARDASRGNGTAQA